MNEASKYEWDLFPVYIAVGSNIEPEKNLPESIQKLRTIFEVVAVSSAWHTPAVGFKGEDFLNAVVLIKTPLSPKTLKNEVLRPLEALLGRVRTEEKFSARTIDMDILLCCLQTVLSDCNHFLVAFELLDQNRELITVHAGDGVGWADTGLKSIGQFG